MGVGSFLKDVSGFKLLEGKNIVKDIVKNPIRAFVGSADPLSTKVWNKVLHRDDKPLVDQMGGATKERSDQARAAGIDPKNGESVEKVAHVVAAIYGANALGSLAGGAASSTSGAASGGLSGGTSISALTPEAVYAGGVPAANAAVAGITPGAIGSAGGGLGVAGSTVAAGGLGGTASISALTPEAVQAGGTGAATTSANAITPEAISSSGGGATNVAPSSSTDYSQQSSSNSSSEKRRQRPYEDINNNGGMNSVSADLFSRYNKNEGNFNDGNKIVMQDGMAVLMDENGNEIGRRPNDASLHSMLSNVERG